MVTPPAPDETSFRYHGWRIVVVCFVVATFGWGLGFYGQSVYLAELARAHGWPSSQIAIATTFFYLTGALLVAFVGDVIRAIGARACLLGGIAAMALGTALLGRITAPWQLYAVDAILAVGWAGTSLGAITNTLGLWFDRRRGMAISLALNGASFGGIAGVPLLVALIGTVGFSGATTAAAIAAVVLLMPLVAIVVVPPHLASAASAASAPRALSSGAIRSGALRDPAFLTATIAFSLVLFAQVGFIVHLIAYLDPLVGRERAALAMSLLTAMAVVGRVLLSVVIDRLNQRLVSALSFASQALALAIAIMTRDAMLLMVACALFGFSVGNLITLPALIIQREFPVQSFGVLVALNTAINQVAYAFGPGMIGLLRDASGSYTLPFTGCIALQLAAAALIMVRRGRR
ncbi:MFS transporter [Rhodopseudomonas palustris]|uniref:MFS transporter n=1 Tax=Rhodopseudomonas palustris TaxID=1076 RepID=A0A323UHY0_RHOPL|nr:MFS transporter [Rhodopseudomonas palustris]PZA10576.1 MFS transporter [Rhodopseudomonas palustris]